MERNLDEQSGDDFPGIPGAVEHENTVPGDESGASRLVEAAKEVGGVEVIDKDDVVFAELEDSSVIDDDVKRRFEHTPTTQDIIGTGKITFHPELPQTKFENLVGHTFLLEQVQMVDGWDGFYGISNFGLILLQLRDGRKCTSLAGGIAVVKQLRALIAKKRFPVKVTLTEKPGQNGYYYLFA